MVVGVLWCPLGVGQGCGSGVGSLGVSVGGAGVWGYLASETALPERERDRETERGTWLLRGLCLRETETERDREIQELEKVFPGLPARSVKKVSKKSSNPRTRFSHIFDSFSGHWRPFRHFLTLQARRPGKTFLRLFRDFGRRGPRDSCMWRSNRDCSTKKGVVSNFHFVEP